MPQPKEIEDLVERFVDDIGGVVEHARRAGLAAALESLGGTAADRRPRAPVSAAQPQRSTRPASFRRKPVERPPRQHADGARQMPPKAAPAFAERNEPQAAGRTDAGHAPTGARQAGKDLTDREARVLDAVRVLVRATAAEIARRCELPNGTVYVVLRALLTHGHIAKTDSSRGAEYSLVSRGGIRPFKRVKSPRAPGEGPAPRAAVES